jgi:hypothetical protein
MKAKYKKLFVFAFFLFGIMNSIAQVLPAPLPPPPPPPGLPIDENIFCLFTLAVLFGIYIIYTRKIQNKTSV